MNEFIELKILFSVNLNGFQLIFLYLTKTVMDYDEPFWNEETILPKENALIKTYTIRSSLYSTRYAYYYLSHDSSDNEEKLIKFIKLTKEKIHNIQNEVEITETINHPNIVKLQEAFRYDAYICLVFSYKNQQSLYDYIIKQYPNGIPEDLSAKMMQQMLEAIGYLHGWKIWHRNVKPENFFVSNGSELNIVLGNFEFAKHFQDGEKGTQYLGSPEFMAPEIINKAPYDGSVDIWSLGITLFVMLTGQFPFPRYNFDQNEFLSKASKGILNFEILKAHNISKEAIDLIHNMCKFNPSERIRVHNALKHPWLVKHITAQQQ